MICKATESFNPQNEMEPFARFPTSSTRITPHLSPTYALHSILFGANQLNSTQINPSWL